MYVYLGQICFRLGLFNQNNSNPIWAEIKN